MAVPSILPCSSPGLASDTQKLVVLFDSQIVAAVISCFREIMLFTADVGVGSRKHSC